MMFDTPFGGYVYTQALAMAIIELQISDGGSIRKRFIVSIWIEFEAFIIAHLVFP